MAELVDIDDLIVDRPVRLGPSVLQSALEQSIKEVGVQQPLVVKPDWTVIDGVRRLTGARSVGLTQVPVVFTDDFDDVIEVMARTATDGLHAMPADHYRIWYLSRATREMVAIPKSNKYRITPAMKKLSPANRQDAKGVHEYRRMLSLALGGAGYSRIVTAVFLMARVFDHTHQDHRNAMRCLEDIEAGKYALTSVVDRMGLHRRAERTPPYEQQRTILDNSMVTLPATLKALGAIQLVDDRFSAEELDQYIKCLVKERANLYRVLNTLRQKRGEK